MQSGDGCTSCSNQSSWTRDTSMDTGPCCALCCPPCGWGAAAQTGYCKMRGRAQLCFTFSGNDPQVQLQSPEDFEISICGSGEPGPPQTGEAGHSQQVMNSSSPLAAPVSWFISSWYMIHGLKFYLITVIWFGRGGGQCLVCFRHLHFISAERADSGWQEGQRNSHNHSSSKPST